MKFDHRSLAYAFLRVAVGVMFFFYGVGKFRGGIGAFVNGMSGRFKGKLPEFLVWPFATALPFIEVAVGALLIAGLFTRWALVAANALMILLTFGAVIEPNPGTVGTNVTYAFILSALLFAVEYDRYSVEVRVVKRRG